MPPLAIFNANEYSMSAVAIATSDRPISDNAPITCVAGPSQET